MLVGGCWLASDGLVKGYLGVYWVLERAYLSAH